MTQVRNKCIGASLHVLASARRLFPDDVAGVGCSDALGVFNLVDDQMKSMRGGSGEYLR